MDWCKNYDIEYPICKDQECGHCLLFKLKRGGDIKEMTEIIVKYGTTFKKGKEFHRIDLTIRKNIASVNYMESDFKDAFNRLKNEVIELKENILKDARI